MLSLPLAVLRRRFRMKRNAVYAGFGLMAVVANFVPFELGRHAVTGLWIWELPMVRRDD